MANVKLSAIAVAGSNPASTDQVVGVTTGTTDNLFSFTRVAATISPILTVFGSAAIGGVPASGGGTTNFLRADGTWAAPPGGGGLTINTTTITGGTTGRLLYDNAATVGETADIVYNTNAPYLTFSGATISGSATTSFLSIAGTWNTTGVVDAAIFLNVTNTASGTNSLLMDLQVGGTSQFSVGLLGLITVVAGANGGPVGGGLTFAGGSSAAGGLFYAPFGVSHNITFNSNSTDTLTLTQNQAIFAGTAVLSWSSGNPVTNSVDTTVLRDAAGILAQRNGTNANTFRVYNTFTDASDYERGVMDWTTTGNTLIIGQQNAGTGSARPVSIVSGSTEAIHITTAQAVEFPGVGTTASAANAFLDNTSSPANNLLRSTSSLRYKTDVTEIPQDRLSAIAALRPIEFCSKAPADDPALRFVGYAAEDVARLDRALVSLDREGRPDGVMYDRVLLLKIAALEQEVEKLKRKQ